MQTVTNRYSEEKMRRIYRACLSDILGVSLYQEIFSFFYQAIYCGKYDIVIIAANKCFNLYKLFSRILPNGDERLPLIVSDDAIPYIKKLVKGKRVALLDDIIVHGRTLTDNKNDLSEEGAEMIDIRALIVDKDYDVGSDLNFYYSGRLSIQYWRHVSSKLTTCFDILGQPNTYCGPMLQITFAAPHDFSTTKAVEELFPFGQVEPVQRLGTATSVDYLISVDSTAFNCMKSNDLVFFRFQVHAKTASHCQKARIIPFLIFDHLTTNEILHATQRLQAEKFSYSWKTEGADWQMRCFRYLQYFLRGLNCRELVNRLSINASDCSMIISHDDLNLSFSVEEQNAIFTFDYIHSLGPCSEDEAYYKPETVPISQKKRSLSEFSMMFPLMKLIDEENASKGDKKKRHYMSVWDLIHGKNIKFNDKAQWLSCLCSGIIAIKAIEDEETAIKLVSYAGEESYRPIEVIYKPFCQRAGSLSGQETIEEKIWFLKECLANIQNNSTGNYDVFSETLEELLSLVNQSKTHEDQLKDFLIQFDYVTNIDDLKDYAIHEALHSRYLSEYISESREAFVF